MNFSGGDLINLARVGGPSLAISLFIVLVALWRGWLEMGTSAQRERDFWRTYAQQMKDERDAYRTQVDARQNVVEQLAAQAAEFGALLRDFSRFPPVGSPRPPTKGTG